MIDPDGGEVIVLDVSLSAQPARAKALFGYLPDGQEALPDLRVSELVRLVRALKSLPPQPSAEELVWHGRLGVESVWAQRLATLSLGQHKRVALACALAGNPALLLLDEPTNGLDPSGVELLIELCQVRAGAGLGQVVATNDLDFVRRVVGLRYRLVDGRLQPVVEPVAASST